LLYEALGELEEAVVLKCDRSLVGLEACSLWLVVGVAARPLVVVTARSVLLAHLNYVLVLEALVNFESILVLAFVQMVLVADYDA